MKDQNSANQDLVTQLRRIVGRANVLTGDRQTERFRKGFRSGEGDALAVVKPGTLLELWHVAKTTIEAGKIIIMQAANTGLTEGSTPKGSYDRDVILINTNRMDKIYAINEGNQIVGFPGATLFELEKVLKPYNRQPHSEIGSSCIGASIIGGVCNNSGGALVERGPSYTELSLFARVNDEGRLELINHLGISLGEAPEEILERLEAGEFGEADIENLNLAASDKEYSERVRDVDAATPARFNADKRRLHEASGCAGKLIIFAVRLDTYPKAERDQIFYIGTNDSQVLTKLRRHILTDFKNLPVSAEYMHQDCYDLAKHYGKDTLMMIYYLGTGWLPTLFALKGNIDARLNKIPILPKNLLDKTLQIFSKFWPNMLPKRMEKWRRDYCHHLILRMKNEGVEEAKDKLSTFFEVAEGDYFECTSDEGKRAMLHRFAAAGAAVRYQAVHTKKVEEILALDVALRRNEVDWLEVLVPEIDEQIIHKLYYGHFLCHVLHQDYIVKKGVDLLRLKENMLNGFDKRGAEYPAEHNVGHLYHAKPDLAAFYQNLDPTNSLNPGVGKMSKNKNYAEDVR